MDSELLIENKTNWLNVGSAANDWLSPWNYVRAYRDPLKFLLHHAETSSKVAALRIGPRRDFVVYDPDLVRDVLLANEQVLDRGFNTILRDVMGNGLLSTQGDLHKKMRRRLLPLFDRRRLSMYSATMTGHCELLDKQWTDGETIDIADQMLKLSFDIIVEVVFGTTSEVSNELSGLFRKIIKSTGKTGHLRRMLGSKMTILRDRKLKNTIQRLDTLIYELIEEYRKNKSAKPCFLSMLLELQHPDEASARATNKWARDESITMLIAGHETVATLLAWTWYLLAGNPDEEACLYDELGRVIGSRLPTFEDLPQLRYTAAILYESMRLYPPIWVVVRRPIMDWEACGYVFPAKSYIFVSPFSLHRDARWFQDPDRFDPNRWIDQGEGSAKHKFAYIPFGLGGRKCIGETFGMLEATMVMATLAQKWRLELLPGQNIKADPLISLRPKNGIKMKLVRRA